MKLSNFSHGNKKAAKLSTVKAPVENYFEKYGFDTVHLDYDGFKKWVDDGVAIGKITPQDAAKLHEANLKKKQGLER